MPIYIPLKKNPTDDKKEIVSFIEPSIQDRILKNKYTDCIGIISCESAIKLRNLLRSINDIRDFRMSDSMSMYNISNFNRKDLNKIYMSPFSMDYKYIYYYHAIPLQEININILTTEFSQKIDEADYEQGNIESLHIGYKKYKISRKIFGKVLDLPSKSPPYFVIKFSNGNYTIIKTQKLCIVQEDIFNAISKRANDWKNPEKSKTTVGTTVDTTVGTTVDTTVGTSASHSDSRSNLGSKSILSSNSSKSMSQEEHHPFGVNHDDGRRKIIK